MRNYPNIESRKLSPRHDYYVGYGKGLVWHIYRNGRAGWIAASNDATFTLRGRLLADISAALSLEPSHRSKRP
jgi:hypothetical protein